jgi:outer membrane protein OmpA-like peptidoglycan-associated protein
MRTIAPVVLLLTLSSCASAPPIRLRRVVLYQSGVATFERRGSVGADGLRLALAAHEVDDVLTTLTVVDPDRPEGSPVPSAVVPRGEGAQELRIDVGGSSRPVTVAYAAPSSAWRASYRLVLPDERGSDDAWLQAWAVVDNTSAEDWHDVELVLATESPLSFAVDLRTPRIVQRPNVTGHHVPAIAIGPVRSESSTRGGDDDGDGVFDDRCPDEPEDLDGFEDTDGCPDQDHDGDGIADLDDVCPEDPELYNGLEDIDGCPDRGQVMISESQLRILEAIHFAEGSAEIGASSRPILDAVAATLVGNPQLARVEVQGHADAREESPWRLSAERAAAVLVALTERGVDASRLVALPLGDSRPLVNGSDARNRRVSFEIPEREETTHAPREVSRGGVSREAMRSAGAPLPSVGTGGTRFSVARTVDVPAGSSAMVTILGRGVSGEDVLLYRPDPNAPASQSHPFRAARFANRSGVDLVPGPISLFRGGELVGQGLLDALRAGENAFVPYAIDDASHVEPLVEETSEPSRILGVVRGRVRFERTEIVRTRYRIEAGRAAAARLYVRHTPSHGYEAHDLPPGTETRPGAWLVPIHIEGGRDATLTVDERRPTVFEVSMVDDLSADLRPYLAGSRLDAPDEARLRQLLDDRDALLRIMEQARLAQVQLGESGARLEELRRSVRALDERGGRSSAAVRRRLTERLDAASRDAEQIATQLATLRVDQVDARERLREAASEWELTID